MTPFYVIIGLAFVVAIRKELVELITTLVAMAMLAATAVGGVVALIALWFASTVLQGLRDTNPFKKKRKY